jgi:alanine or glycine:cation symporter, AGCS family
MASVDERINDAVQPVTDAVVDVIFYAVPVGDAEVPLIVVWLMLGAVFTTLYFGFINIRGFRQSLRIVRGDYQDDRDPGEVTHFQALTTALSGTVGLGNIAGVAVAIAIGGPGATFWMIVAGLFGMTLKFTECTLGVKYRREDPDGTVSGGPMYYLSRGLADRGLPRLGAVLAFVFCFFCIFGSLGGGNMFQSNQAHTQFVEVTGGEGSFFDQNAWVFGLVVAVLVGIVIIGGIKSIARVTSRVVPFMAAIYVVAGLVVIFANLGQVPGAFESIVTGAFSPEGVTGGFIGALIQGMRRATFSNEAGIGSAAIAHSAVKTREPVTEGYVALLEPFIDTVVICTMTALVIIISGVALDGDAEGVALTSGAYETVLPWFPNVLAVAVILFAFSTMLAWAYYGSKALGYLFGGSRTAELVFKLVFCVFIVIGATMDLSTVIDFSDSMLFAMAIANIAGLYLLVPVVRAELRAYEEKLRTGEVRKT